MMERWGGSTRAGKARGHVLDFFYGCFNRRCGAIIIKYLSEGDDFFLFYLNLLQYAATAAIAIQSKKYAWLLFSLAF